MHGHWSHDIVEVPPRMTGTHQFPVKADHESRVHFNPERTQAIIRCHGGGSGGCNDRTAVLVTLFPAGSNGLLEPPRVALEFIGEQPSSTRRPVVTVESLLYALKQMQDAVPRSGVTSA